MYDLAIRHGQCYIDHGFSQVNIYIKDEKIAMISSEILPSRENIDATGLYVLPGLIDPHVHLGLNIGEFTSADDFISGSSLAARGGVTTVIDFIDPVLDASEVDAAFERRIKAAKGCSVDFALHSTLGNYTGDIDALIKVNRRLGMSSVKVFTTYSESNRRCSYDVIKMLLDQDALVMVHAEDDDMILPCHDIRQYEESRSEASELSAIKQLLKLKQDKGKLYIVHISSGNTLAYLSGVDHAQVYLESCPQYFYLDRTRFLGESGPLYILAPPLRSKRSVEIINKTFYHLDTIGTDHCPFMAQEKMKYKNVAKMPKGIGSLGLSFQLMYQKFGAEVIDKMTENPASIFGLHQKGKIAVGKDADFAIMDLNTSTPVDISASRCDYTTYEEAELTSEVHYTLLRGHVIYHAGLNHEGLGRYIRRDS